MCGTDGPQTDGGSFNQLGGRFLNGRPLPAQTRRMMIKLASQGVRPCHISRMLKVSSGCVSKILRWYQRTGLMGPKATGGSRPRLLTPHIISTIARYKRSSPSLFAWEIRERLTAEQVCRADKVPSVSSINRILKKLQRNHGMEEHTLEGDTYDKIGELKSALKNLGETEQQSEACDLQSTHQRYRTNFSQEQYEMLEKEFLRGHYPDLFAREKLSTDTSLSQNTIKVWFSNRRAKMRREANSKDWPSHSLAQLHSLGRTTNPFPLSSDWLCERTTLPVTTQLDSRSSLALNAETSTFSLAHCSSNTEAGFPPDHHLDEANMLCSQHRQPESTYKPTPFTQWASHPSFTEQYVCL